MTKRAITPVSEDPQATPETEIHETQNSLGEVAASATRSRAQRAPDGEDALLSNPAVAREEHEDHQQRIELIEEDLSRLSARVRLLEKQAPGSMGPVPWLIALLFFAALAVTWRLVFAPH